MYPQQKTNIEFLKELTLKNLYYSNGDFNVIGEYLNVKKKILLKDKYSFHKMSPDGLLRGNKLTANSSTDKKQYCENLLKEFGINLSLVDVSFLNKVIYNTEHGLCVSPFSRLLKIKTPNISSAIDKTAFMISEFTKIHNNKYNYEKSVFNNAREKIKIECKIHGYFEQDYSAHKSGQNCGKCANISRLENIKSNGGWGIRDWWHKANKSKKFDSFKIYIIKCWNENEQFYKIGRTFYTVKNRFLSKESMPYNYKIIQIRESSDAFKIYCLERVFKKYNEKNKYNPQINFNGKQECFTKIIDINNGKEIS